VRAPAVLGYRPDIDGLRAIAVLAVIGYHFGFPFFQGGYVGVDIFFVLSGYLIGGNMIEQLRSGSFSLVNFYERRFRRILPALFVMLAAVSLCLLPLSMPADLVNFGWSLGSASLSLSNMTFQSEGYFGGLAETKPLLHTWSLAVEDQFYLLFPLLLLALWRRPRLSLVVFLIGGLSLAVSTVEAIRAPSAAFFTLTSRAWELLLGFQAFLLRDHLPRRQSGREAVSVLGGLLLIGGAVLCAYRPPFPGVTALPTTLGTAILVATGSAHVPRLNRVLAIRPLVAIGLISYSLYLWHWPIWVLSHIEAQLPPAAMEWKFAALGLTFLLAYASWRFVEQPFRDHRRFTSRSIFGLASGAAVVLSGAALAMVAFDGLPGRLPLSAQRIAAIRNYDPRAAFRSGRCFLGGGGPDSSFDLPTCTASHPGRSSVLILGDSHAAHLWQGFDRVMTGSDIWQITGAFCRASLREEAQRGAHCKVLARTLSELFARSSPDLVVISYRWTSEDLNLLGEMLRTIHRSGARALVVGPSPLYNVPLPTLLVHEIMTGHVSRHAFLQSGVRIERDLAAVAAREGAGFLSLEKRLCNPAGDRCETRNADGTPLIFDEGHLTPEGSVKIARFFVGADPALSASAASAKDNAS